MTGFATLGLPFRLAWRQLRHEPARLAAALSGVLFACLLIFMQLGFMDALFDSAVKPQEGMRADLYLMHRQTEALWRTQPFPRARLMQALGVEGVDRVVPMYVGNAAWKNPITSLKRTLLVFGADPEGGLLAYDGMDEADREAIRRADVILFDERSKPEFGPVPKLLAEGPLFVELANRRVEVAGLFRIGATFGSEGNAITSETNFLRLFPNRTAGHVDVGAIFLRPGADAATVKAAIAPLLAPDVMLMTHAELVAFELRYWAEAAPIGDGVFQPLSRPRRHGRLADPRGGGLRARMARLKGALHAGDGEDLHPADARSREERPGVRADLRHVRDLGPARHSQAARRQSGGHVLRRPWRTRSTSRA